MGLKERLRDLADEADHVAGHLDEIARNVERDAAGLDWLWSQLTHDEQAEVVATVARRTGVANIHNRAGTVIDASLLVAASKP